MNDIIEQIKLIDESNDIYGTYNKAVSICNFLELEANEELLSKNNLIAIYGSWGSGKSCLMKTIEQNLNKEKFKTKWFDTWKYEKDDNLPYSLFKFILQDDILNNLKEKGTFLLNIGYGLLKSLVKGVDFNFNNNSNSDTNTNTTSITINPGEMLDEVEIQKERIKNNIENKKCLWEKIQEFEKEFSTLKIGKEKLVIFLDDLDRCESDNIVTLISSIKLLLSSNPQIIFIIGIDKQAVTLALQNRYNNDFNKADEYLEKIFPINFQMSSNLQMLNYLKFISRVTDLNEEDSKVVFDFMNKIKFFNARHVKKVFRKYFIIKDYLKSKEIDLNDKYVVIFVLYMIILNTFYNDEYQCLMMEDKEKIYKNIKLHYNSADKRKEWQFNDYFKKCVVVRCNKKIDVYDFVIRFSSYKIKEFEIPVNISQNNRLIFLYDKWVGLFDNNVCNDFLEFVVNNPEMLKIFYEGEKYKSDIINNYIKIIDYIL